MESKGKKEPAREKRRVFVRPRKYWCERKKVKKGQRNSVCVYFWKCVLRERDRACV